MHQHAERADQSEGDEAQRQQAAEYLVEQQAGELRQHQCVELALAGDALVEHEREFDDPQRSGRAECQVEQDLEALTGEVAGQLLEQGARQHEEAAHRVGEPYRQECLRQADPAVRQQMAPAAGESGIVAALDVAAADGEVIFAGLQRRQHVGQAGLVVLQVAVHHGHELCRGRQAALDHRG